MKRFLIHLLFATLLPSALFSQTAERPFAIGLWGGITQYNGDLGNGFYASNGPDQHFHIGLSAAWFIANHFDFSMNATYGTFGYEEDSINKFESNQLQWNCHVRVSLFQEGRYRINPYGFAGIGVAYLSDFKKPGTDIFFPFGAGLKISLTDRAGLILQETFAYTDHDDRDGAVKNSNDAFLMHSIGLTYNFATAKDEDQDGVKDKKDKCPQTPVGVAVDSDGCPLDRDGDGIADYVDACPDVKGVATAKGCPDKDGDTVVDSLDRCVDVAGLVTADPANNGCPDQDGDGITDADDRCPQEKGIPALKGCPDRDGDSIADLDDKCPDEAGADANGGCPEVKQAVDTLSSIAINTVLFETGKSTVRSRYRKDLDALVLLLNQNPSYKLDINGHTDNTGGPERNATLSQERAAAVQAYLTKKGIDAGRLSGKGFSDSLPAGDNSTAAGRTKNRRAEFKLHY